MAEYGEAAAVIGVVQREGVVAQIEKELRIGGVGVTRLRHGDGAVSIAEEPPDPEFIADAPEIGNPRQVRPRRCEEVRAEPCGSRVTAPLNYESRLQPMK